MIEPIPTERPDEPRLPSPSFGAPSAAPSTSITALIQARAAEAPDRCAVEHLSASLTYGELDDASSRLAQHLRQRGVGRGDVVGVFLERSIAMVIGILAVLKTGAAYAPQDARISPRAQLGRIAEQARMRVVLTTERFVGTMPEGLEVIRIDEPREATSPAFSVASAPSDTCAVIFTSGTTGVPNGVQVSHGNLVNLLTQAPGDLGITAGTRVGQVLNIAFDMAMWEMFGALVHGGTLVIRGTDIAATAERVDVLVATPSILATLSSHRSTARTVVVAGERCPQALADEWAREHRFLNSCGPTEITIINTLVEHHPGRPLTIGAPVPGTSVYVLDPDLRPVREGESGEMWVGGAGVTAGYIGNPHLTEERYVPDPFAADGSRMFRTRDVGRWTPRGELEHLSRTDDQVKVRGFRVELDSVSRALESAPGCSAAVTVRRDARNLAAVVVPATVDPDAARTAVAELLPYYCVPTEVVAADRLPLTPRGKVDREAVLRLLDAAAATTTRAAA
ncbi:MULTISPECIES: amino acid adenylation domain-containing protein [unclassified Microbacterium]|uniref:amino acid adenylation domain-containing protein n=1 Tax=unclassified Microbacterium TaxID=2609290 RepID=UPI0025EC6F2C|nr:MULTISPECIES: amino acid adenylation domain-containing protein [unclassified Microbacterium]